MSFDNVTTLTGRSGAAYTFNIAPRTTRFNARGGVYVMAKEMAGAQFRFCFVGQTADMSVRPFNKDKTACFQKFGVDHIFHLDEPDAGRRAQIVTDLVQAYTPVCNTP